MVFIALSATLMSTLINVQLLDWIRWFVGCTFLVFGGFKLISYESFLEIFPQYDLIAHRFRLYALAYPFIEVILGICFILDMISGFRNLLALAIVATGLFGVCNALMHRGPTKDHTWLGRVFKLPLSTAILFENLIVTFLLIVLVIGKLFTN